jgi:MYXO-CTERM domain-containing protein
LARTLDPLAESSQRLWEWADYGLTLAGLFAVWVWRRRVKATDRIRYDQVLAEV